MAKPYSSDLRQRATALVEAGQSRRAVARLLNLDKSTVILWVKEFRATGKQSAMPMGGRRRFALLGQRDWLLARIAAAPDLTAARCEPNWLSAASRSATTRSGASCARSGSRSKKSLRAAEQDRPDVVRKRERWKRHQRRVDPARLVFVDG